MEKITLILDDIERLCKHVTKGHELKDDLRQEVILTMLETFDNLKHLSVEDLRKIAAKIIYEKWYTREGAELGRKHTNSFAYLFRDFNYLAGYDVEEIRGLTHSERETIAEEFYCTIMQSDKLTHLDKEILKEYVRRNCKISQFSTDAGVSRPHLTKRINKIIEKCRHL